MQVTVELTSDEEQGGFTARIPDIPAYGEGETEDEAIADLREAMRGYIETFGLADALARISHPTFRRLDWDLAELAHCPQETRRCRVRSVRLAIGHFRRRPARPAIGAEFGAGGASVNESCVTMCERAAQRAPDRESPAPIP